MAGAVRADSVVYLACCVKLQLVLSVCLGRFINKPLHTVELLQEIYKKNYALRFSLMLFFFKYIVGQHMSLHIPTRSWYADIQLRQGHATQGLHRNGSQRALHIPKQSRPSPVSNAWRGAAEPSYRLQPAQCNTAHQNHTNPAL